MRKRLGWLALPLLLAAVIPARASDGYTPAAAVGATSPAPESQPQVTHLTLWTGGPAQYGQPFTVRATLTLADGTPVQGGVIDFVLAGKVAGVGVTDQQGDSSLTQLATHGAGRYQVLAVYRGDVATNVAGSAAATELTIVAR